MKLGKYVRTIHVGTKTLKPGANPPVELVSRPPFETERARDRRRAKLREWIDQHSDHTAPPLPDWHKPGRDD